jgi:chorismate mutase
MTLASLNALREQIDAIDAELLRLIDKRAGLARDIAAAKAKETAATPSVSLIRPDREALLLRRLMDTPRIAASDAVIVHIWRELIAESLRIQSEETGGLVINMTPADRAGDLLAWTRERFGAAPSVVAMEKTQDIITAARDPRKVGVIGLDARHGPWWGRLLLEPHVRIMAALPEMSPDRPVALAIAAVALEPTGDDQTFFVTDWPGSEAELLAALSEQGFAGERLAHVQGLSLVSLSGFVQENDARLKDRFGSLSGVVGVAPRL